MRIIGTGSHLPGPPVDNFALSRVMDTDDEWIRQRTGIATRHYAADGEGASDLAAVASARALEAAGLVPSDIDYILFNTMTPDYMIPGSGGLLGAKLGITCPALDMRTQCAAFLYSLQVAQGLVSTGAARRILVVGAEAHAGFMPWTDWDLVRGEREGMASPEAREAANPHRGWSIIFGDGAGAVILGATEDEGPGLKSMDLYSDGSHADWLWLPIGFHKVPFVTPAQIEKGGRIPSMEGRDLFKHAVTQLPRCVRTACERAGVTLDQVDWFVAHQANQRINDAIGERLKVDPAKVPSNIERAGNTSGGTIPILLDEMRRDGRLQPNQTVCVLALGAGLHWGAGILRT
jgi:3-oxoacyl-[acyl-carrier-protein] synthase-3